MKISIGADHAGYKVKEHIKTMLKAMGHTVTDHGTLSEDPCDYPDFASAVAADVSEGRAERGVLVCGTGIGMSITANKYDGVRAAVCYNEYATEMSRRHNDANVFCIGARTFSTVDIERFIKVWLETPFEGGRHETRLKKITSTEKRSR